MKSKLLLLSLLMLLAVATNYAQSGIAIQGIARDNNNTAKTNAMIVLEFTIYHLPDVQIYNVSQTLNTDSFGVFSTVIIPGDDNETIIANNQAYLKIEEGSSIISDEPLRHVPYAISANNGVPTGSIMPFVGKVAPTGWVLCDGSTLPSGSEKLKEILGANNAPDLRGMFLRGTGTSIVNGKNGPSLKATQGDDNKAHTHAAGTLDTEGGAHTHKFKESAGRYADIGGGGSFQRDGYVNDVIRDTETEKLADGITEGHDHTIVGNTGEVGTESRPVNYGVNYIIKL